MKKLVLGMGGLLLAANLAGAQSVESALDNAPKLAVLEQLDGAQTSNNHQDNNEDPGKSKTFSKSFSVDAGDKLSLTNKYGAITIKTWDKKEVKVDISIKAFSKDAADAQRLLDDTNIESGKSGDQISFKTIIGSMDGPFGRSGKNKKTVWRREVKIDYIVYVPSTIALTVNNQYGGLSIADFSGALYAKIQYGAFTAGNLGSTNNYVNVQYGQTDISNMNKGVIKQQYGAVLNIGTVGTLELDAQYVPVNIAAIKGDAVIKQQYGKGLSIGAVNNLELNAQYTNVNVGMVNGNANIKQQYNSISIGSVNKLNINTQYTTVKVGTLKGDGSFDLSYNKLSVDRVLSGCKNLTVNSNYTGVSLVFAKDYNADLEVKTKYGGFNSGSNVHSKMVSESGSSKLYNGKIGNGGTGNLNISANYGSVSLN